MSRFRQLCYKSKWFDGHLVDNAIDIHTRTVNTLLNPAHMTEGFWERRRIINALACSHDEGWWPDEYGNFVSYTNYTDRPLSECVNYLGECFTSTMGQTGGKNREGDGICIRPASEVLKHPERLFYFEYHVLDEALEYAKDWARMMVKNNKGYDKKDILTFFKFNENKRVQNINDGKLICSGAVWVFMDKLMQKWSRINIDSLRESEMFDLWLDHSSNSLPSPLLLALWQYMAGSQAFDLATGKPILIKG